MWNIHNRKKSSTEDINSWVFHEDIKTALMKNYSKKLRKYRRFVLVFYAIFLLLIFVHSAISYQSIIKSGVIVLCNVAIGLLGAWLLMRLAVWLWKWRTVRKYWPLAVFPLVALAIVATVVHIYPGNEALLRSDVLGFCGDFLAFLGTFCLGYFIYVQDKDREREKKREKVKLLHGLMQTANSELCRLSRLARDEEYLKIPENRACIGLITYDPNWTAYYYEYESLEGANYDLRRALEFFFDNITQVNVAIKAGQIETAAKLYNRHMEQEVYSIEKYDGVEATICLLGACDEHCILNTKSWIDRQENVDLVNKLCRKYYYLIENYIYAWLLKHHVDSTEKNDNLQREVVDWLFANSSEIEGELSTLKGKRILSQVVFDCSLKFKEKSRKVNYVWGEYHLR